MTHEDRWWQVYCAALTGLCANPVVARHNAKAFAHEAADAAVGPRETKGAALSVQEAARIAHRYGMIDGGHHKQWVIDQMLRTTLGPEGYEQWVKDMNSDPDYLPWDEGIPP